MNSKTLRSLSLGASTLSQQFGIRITAEQLEQKISRGQIVSERELNTKAFKDDIKVMEVKRTLSDSLKQMTVSQTVFLPDFNKLTNWSSYSKIIIQ